MHHPTDRITHTTAFVTPVVEHWLEREIAQRVHPMKDRSMSERSTSELRPAQTEIEHACLHPVTGIKYYYSAFSGQRPNPLESFHSSPTELKGQVRSECLTCTFRASCCSARLSRARHWRVQGSTTSPTGIGSMPEGGLMCYGIWNVP